MLNICLKINHWFKNTLFQPHCILCLHPSVDQPKQGLALCSDCLAELSRLPHELCPQCARASFAGALCGECLRHPPYFDACVAVFDYAFPVNRLIAKYKYTHQLFLVETLSNQLLQAVQACNLALPDVIIAMPLHPERLAQRGFNQSLELAKPLALALAVPISAACERVINTQPQAGLKQQTRIRNIRNAFVCRQPMTGMRVAVVDDVMTTGASLNELARVLKQQGAAHVQCWVVARTLA